MIRCVRDVIGLIVVVRMEVRVQLPQRCHTVRITSSRVTVWNILNRLPGRMKSGPRYELVRPQLLVGGSIAIQVVNDESIPCIKKIFLKLSPIFRSEVPFGLFRPLSVRLCPESAAAELTVPQRLDVIGPVSPRAPGAAGPTASIHVSASPCLRKPKESM